VNEPAAHPLQLGFAVDRDVDRPILVAFLGGIGEMLTTVFDPFDRSLEELGGSDNGDVLRIDAKLGTEAAPHLRSRHPQPAFVESNERGQRLKEVVSLLRGSPHGNGVIAPFGNEPAPFDRMRGAAMLPKLLVE